MLKSTHWRQAPVILPLITVTNFKVIKTYAIANEIGKGKIVIEEYDAVNKNLTGTFKFTAVNADEENVENPTINFTEGVFYKVPVSYASGGLE